MFLPILPGRKRQTIAQGANIHVVGPLHLHKMRAPAANFVTCPSFEDVRTAVRDDFARLSMVCLTFRVCLQSAEYPDSEYLICKRF